MTSTLPCRRMIRHFSHIGLTLGRTFTKDSYERGAVGAAGGSTLTHASDRATKNSIIPSPPWQQARVG